MSILVEGQRFERYRVIRRLGSGVTGESYEVENLVLQQKATLKLLHPWATLAEAARRQFFREMQGICRLRHNYLAEMIDYGEIDAQLYVARRYVSSGSLLGSEGRLWFRSPLPLTEAIQYACQLAQALEYIHQQGYIHGALALSNILVLRSANVEHAPDYTPFLLADVGLAHFVRRFGQPKITLLPLTAAPEQLGGRLTPASDQFALAVILYLWLAGRPPYLGSPEEIEHLKLTETITPLSSFNPAVSFEQEGVLRRALAVYPEDRYPSLQAFANALAATLTRPSNPFQTEPESEPVAEFAYDIAPQTTVEPPHESDTETAPEAPEAGPEFEVVYDAEPALAVEPVETTETVIDQEATYTAEADSTAEPAATPLLAEPDAIIEPAATPVLVEHDVTTEPAATPVLAERDSTAEPAAILVPIETDNTAEPAATPVLIEHDVTTEPVATPVLAEHDITIEPVATPVLLADTTPDTEPEKPEPLPEPAPDIIMPIPEPEQPPEPLPAPAPEPASPQIVPPTEPEPVTEPPPQPAPDIFTPLPEPEQATQPPQASALSSPPTGEESVETALEPGIAAQEQCEQQVVARLVIISPFTGTTSGVVLAGDELTIGRAGSSDILLDFDDKTSRHHALLRREDGLYVLYDRQSANGVFVNGQKIPVETDIGCPLSNGDRIHIGNYELRFFVEVLAENFSH